MQFQLPVKKGMEIVIESKIGVEIVMYGVIQEGIETWDTKKNEEDMKRKTERWFYSNSKTILGKSNFFEFSRKKKCF